ncbi:MAG TPA: carboxypeptidase-like regulatory domain-containing protein [Polyangiaceae bacterium]|nr:carboxypeptidase-like regulatory domain-containing protein [Polyangiaceae bacterium]
MVRTLASRAPERRTPRVCPRAAACISALVLFSTFAALPRRARARDELRVRADAELVNLGLSRSENSVELSGALHDDAGHAIAEASIELPLLPGDSGERPSACRPSDSPKVVGGTVIARTDAFGFFCLRLPAGSAVEGRELRYAGDRFHSAAVAKVPAETGKRRIAVEFESRELVASLDSPSFVVWVTTREVKSGSTGDPVRLVLFHRPSPDAPEAELGVTDVQLGSTARFDVETRALGGPGQGKLVVRFAGTNGLAPASDTALFVRRATAHLSLAAPPRASDPSDGVELSVAVSSVLGAVNEGWVEALSGGSSAGVSKVEGGAAHVVAVFAAARGKPAQVFLRYIPASDGFVAQPPLLVEVPLLAPSAWSGTPWLLGVAAIAYWVVRAWLRPSRRETKAIPRTDAPTGRAAVEVLSTDSSRSGWRGHVTDAHDGFPIAGARVSIVVPVFDGEGVAGAQTTAEDGSFFLAHVEAARNDGARLVVTAPYHTTLSGAAPADGTLAICLVSRRRTLVNRLVAWAKASPRPWGRGREPTPLELAEAARRHEQTDVAGWASAVAEAAYGPTSPDERRESELLAREPPLEVAATSAGHTRQN